MSWRSVAFASALALLAGCGFRPLYGVDSATHAPSATAHLAAIEIPPLAERTGQELRNLLIDEMHPSGPAGDYRYRLNVGVREADINLGLQQNASSTRGQVRLTAEYFLVDSGSSRTLLHMTIRNSTGYNILVNQFGTVLSTEDARKRGLKQIADEMVEQIALYFATKS